MDQVRHVGSDDVAAMRDTAVGVGADVRHTPGLPLVSLPRQVHLRIAQLVLAPLRV